MNYILCIESSRMRGMGHLFHCLLYANYLKEHRSKFIVLINEDAAALRILQENEIPYELVDFADESDWESVLIKKYTADVWLEDKFETSEFLASHVKKNKQVLFCMVDDFSQTAEMVDLYFGGMIFLTGKPIYAKHYFAGTEYVILNKEIDIYKKQRINFSKIIVSLGGSDPYGNTVEVVKELSKTDYDVEVVIGPDFVYREQLTAANSRNFPIKQFVPSLIKEFSRFDFAITGGGGTCCEANASGLPCMIIANAEHEKHTGIYMQKQGSCIFAGDYENWDRNIIKNLSELDIATMSERAMALFDTRAVERIFQKIEQVCNERRSIFSKNQDTGLLSHS